MGKEQAGEPGKAAGAGSRRRRPAETTAAGEAAGRRLDGSSASTGASPGSSRTDPLALERGSFRPPEEAPPPRTAAELEAEREYEPAPPELIEWTPERAAALVRGLGFALHTLDPVGHVEGGEELWRWTRDDALEAGEPLARIFNRYSPMRRLAGLSDEAEAGAIMLAYVRRNMADRGRVIAVHAEAAEQAAGGQQVWVQQPPTEPEPGPEHGFAPWAGSEPPPA